jgi:DMSO/TMAO reductase YedYZ molybdopterin-dependent catalytic subunit
LNLDRIASRDHGATHEESTMNTDVLLKVDGAVERPLELTYAGLNAFPEAEHVMDVSRYHATRKGDGVDLEAIFRLVGIRDDAKFVTLHASRDDFHVSVPLEPLRGQGIVVYRVGVEPLKPEQGGPIRLIIKDPASCHTGELDDCANVKYLDRIELTIGRGRDTRPSDEDEHAALHEAQGDH